MGDYRRAIANYSRAIENNAQHKNAYYNRGLVYASLGRHKRAIEDFNAVLALDTSEGRAYNNRGIAHDNLGNYQAAIADYEKAIALGAQGPRLPKGFRAITKPSTTLKLPKIPSCAPCNIKKNK